MDRAPVLRRLLPPQRLVLLGVYAVIALIQLLQSVGRTTFDTKLDLLVDPARFLSQSLTLWSPHLGMGEVQNQAYGYLFPLGPVYWLGHVLALPVWLTERVWSTALTIVAFEGARRLALAWGGLGWRGALLVGAAFVAAPRFLTTIGSLTGELLPTAMLPWAVLPIVLARRGRLGWLPGAALSGVAVLFMGGVNAVETVAVLPLPAIVLSHAVWLGNLPRRCLAAWLGAVVAACSWWLGPLLLLGRYSPPFLEYIESAANTTGPLGWVNSVRGADHWVAYVTIGGRPWWPAGYSLATSSWLVVATAVVAALSLAGLASRRVPDRACLTVPLVLGLVCLVAPHGGGWSGGLVATELRSSLDGPLAALRNVHKVDPLVRLPLALGFGYLAHDARVALAGLLARVPRWATRASTAGSVIAGCCAVVVLGAAAQPAAAGELRQPPGWSEIPTAWQRAARAVDALPAGSRVLVAPATGFGRQVWGNTVDEPLQALTGGDWVSRGQAPLVPGANIRLLDSVERLLAGGHGSVGLAPLLARSGITHVLLRTDLDPGASDAPSPAMVASALGSSPGLTLVHTFGVPRGAGLPLQLWRVDTGNSVDPRVSLTPVSAARVVDGGPEALLSLLAVGALREDQPVLLAGQSAPTGPVDILTDSLQRREQAFGRVNEAVSSVMTATQPFRSIRAAHQYPAFAGERQTVARYPGLVSVSASSSSGYVDILGAVHPEDGPYSALDSDGSTAWVSAPFTEPTAQSLTVRMRSPTSLGPIEMQLWAGGGVSAVTSLRVETDSGSVTVPVSAGSDSVTVTPPAGVTRTVRFEVAGVRPDSGSRQVGLADIHLPGVDASRTLVVPGAASRGTTIAFEASTPVRACTYPQRTCDPERAQPAEEAAALDRTFRVAGGGRWRLSAGVVARQSTATTQLFAPVAPGYGIAGSSTLSDDPVVAPTFALDGDPLTSWVSAAGERAPRLTLTWPADRTLSRIQVGLGTQERVRRPTVVRIRSGQERRLVTVGPGSLGFFAPLHTHHMTLTFLNGRHLHPGAFRLPMEISELTIDGLQGIRYAPSPSSVTGQPCGLGPPVFVDGARHETQVTGTLGDVLAGSPLTVSLCRGKVLTLPAGTNRLRIASTAQFQPVRAVLVPVGDTPVTSPPPREVRVTAWGDSRRSMSMGAGGASLLWVRENVNAGWVATTRGRALEPVVVDGWAQGWRVPAGGPSVVTLTFGPQRTYAVALIGGGLLALLLVGTALFFVVRRGEPAPDAAGQATTVDPWVCRGAGALAIGVAAALAGAGLLGGACAAMLPGVRGLLLRRALVVVAVVCAAWLQVVSGGESVGADLTTALAVGLAIGPDLSGRDRHGPERSRSR